jgi:hypothetical protein
MDAIHFQAEVGSDNTIRVPEGINLPSGPLRVTIVPCSSSSGKQEAGKEEGIPKIWEWLREMALEAEKLPTELPSDMAQNHDYYAHGKPRE